MSDRIRFSAQPTPTYEKFQTVTLSVGISEADCSGSMGLHKELSPAEARQVAAEIVRACEIVEGDT